MFTIFHLFTFVCLCGGLIIGFYFGASSFGWFGGVIGAILGALFGLVCGRIPYLLSSSLMRRSLSQLDTKTLKIRLKNEYYISPIIIPELLRRGESIELIKDLILFQLLSENSSERQFGLQNLNRWFPTIAKKIEPFDLTILTNEDRKRIVDLIETTN